MNLTIHGGSGIFNHVTLSAILLLFFASVIHSWYAGNASLRHEAAPLVRDHGGFVFALFTLVLIGAVILLWLATGFWFAVGGALGYFLLLPLITYPLLSAMGLVPTKRSRN